MKNTKENEPAPILTQTASNDDSTDNNYDSNMTTTWNNAVTQSFEGIPNGAPLVWCDSSSSSYDDCNNNIRNSDHDNPGRMNTNGNNHSYKNNYVADHKVNNTIYDHQHPLWHQEQLGEFASETRQHQQKLQYSNNPRIREIGRLNVQNLLDLSTESLADALVSHEKEEGEEDDRYCDDSHHNGSSIDGNRCGEVHNVIISNKMKKSEVIVQNLLDLSTESLADSLISLEEEEGEDDDYHCDFYHDNGSDEESNDDVHDRVYTTKVEESEGNFTNYGTTQYAEKNDVESSNGLYPDHRFSINTQGSSADRSSSYFTLYASNHIIEESSESASIFNMMEIKHALPMAGYTEEEEEEEEENIQVQHYELGKNIAHGTKLLGTDRNNYDCDGLDNTSTKPFIPQMFPSLLDSSMSSSFSVSIAPYSMQSTNEFKSYHGEQRECPEDQLEETPPYSAKQLDYSDTLREFDEEPHLEKFSITSSDLTRTTPLSTPGLEKSSVERYIVDLEMINEESTGNDICSLGKSNTSSSYSKNISDSSKNVSSTPPRYSQVKVTTGVTSSLKTESSYARQTRCNDDSNTDNYKSNLIVGEQWESPSYNEAVKSLSPSTNPIIPMNNLANQNHGILLNATLLPQNQFYNYRHQYYTEQYHYFDDSINLLTSKGDDQTESTCSSVTLSEALQISSHDDEDSCASSSVTGSNPSFSSMSSVTLSDALLAERHDHCRQGFYVATRLGDYIEIRNDEPNSVSANATNTSLCTNKTLTKIMEEYHVKEVEQIGDDLDSRATSNQMSGASSDNTLENVSKGHGSADNDTSVGPQGVDVDLASSTPAGATNNKAMTQAAENVESDLLNMLIPECGVPIPSVMAKMGRRKSKGGMLLPWHSTRLIQNYHYQGGGTGGWKKKNGTSKDNTLKARRKDSNIFSMSSVHTFRG